MLDRAKVARRGGLDAGVWQASNVDPPRLQTVDRPAIAQCSDHVYEGRGARAGPRNAEYGSIAIVGDMQSYDRVEPAIGGIGSSLRPFQHLRESRAKLSSICGVFHHRRVAARNV